MCLAAFEYVTQEINTDPNNNSKSDAWSVLWGFLTLNYKPNISGEKLMLFGRTKPDTMHPFQTVFNFVILSELKIESPV